jgi:hypothetical protein
MKKYNVTIIVTFFDPIDVCVCVYVFLCMNTVFTYIGTQCNMCTKLFPVFGVPCNIYNDQYVARFW